MGIWLKQSTAVTLLFGPFLDEDDGKTAEIGLTITQADVRLSKNGGNMAQKNDATAFVHDELGFYTCVLDATDTNTLGILTIAVHESGALPVWQHFMVVPANEYDSLVLGTDALDVEVASMAANTVTAAAIATDAIDADAIAANAIGASEIAADAITSSELAASAAQEIADQVWDEAKAGHVGAGSFGEEVQAHALTTEVSAVETDTQDIQTRLPAALVGGAMDSDVSAIQANVITAAAIAANAITDSELSTAALNAIADQILQRDVDQVEGAAATHSLTGAILSLVSKIEDNGAGSIVVYETDGVTAFITRAITTDAALDPIESLAVGT